jgi:hypothetical protein
MKSFFQVLLIPLAFIAFFGCEDIFEEDKSICQCELELTFTNMPFEIDGEIVAYEDVTTNVNSGQLSCEEYFSNPGTSIDFIGSVVVDYNNNLGVTVVEYFSFDIDDISEFDIKNAECVGDIIGD